MYYRPWDKDRYMAPDIDAVTEILKEGKIWQAVRHHIDYYHGSQVCLFFYRLLCYVGY